MSGPEDIDALVVARRILAAPKVARISHNEMLALAGCLVGLDQVIDVLEARPPMMISASPAVPTTNAVLAASVAAVLLRHAEWDAAEGEAADASRIDPPAAAQDQAYDRAAETLFALDDALNALKTLFEQEFPHVGS